MCAFNFCLFSNVSFSCSNSVIIHNPECSVFKVLSCLHSADQPYKESDHYSCAQCDTEWNETGSEKLSSDVPFEGVWVQIPVESVGSIVSESTDDTTGQWAEQALNCEKEWHVSWEVGSGADDFFLCDVEQWLKEACNHAQNHGLDNVKHERSAGTDKRSTCEDSIHQVLDSDSAVNDSWHG